MSPRAVLFSITVALGLAAGCVYEAPTRCSADPPATTCASCLARPGCGFCRMQDGSTACLEGGALGPTSTGSYPIGACEEGLWSFRTCGESAPPPPYIDCDRADDCSSCAGYDGCGWCGATGACVRGSWQGPYGTTCASGWATESAMCSGRP